MRTTIACLVLTLATLGTACSESADDHGLAAARKQWVSHLPASYSFTWQQGCECIGDMTRPMRISVTAGQLTNAVFVDDQAAVGEQVRRYLLTIDGVFDKIQDAIDQDAAEVTIEYDPALGYPRSVFVDYSTKVADEELSLQISDFAATAR
jgi:uncharacterized protein DUF6174